MGYTKSNLKIKSETKMNDIILDKIRRFTYNYNLVRNLKHLTKIIENNYKIN
jgi:hypothetical protein